MPAQAQGKGPYGLRFWPKGSGFRFCARADAQRAHTGAGARSVHLGTAFILVEPGLSHVGLGFSVWGLGFRDSDLILVEPGLSPVGRQLISVAANRWHGRP